jgi:Zn-finger nucleic acid-binding protein
MHCPSCIVELNITERQGVEIDYCPQCRGVWLDRGELDKIIERSLDEASPSKRHEDERSRRRDYDEDEPRQRRGRRRKSFLEELFDFD